MRQKKNSIKIGDRVKIISGSQKGFIGNIISILQQKLTFKVILEGIPARIKYKKATREGENTRQEIPFSLDISNVMLWESQTSQTSRIGFKVIDGKKVRYFKKSGNLVN